MTKTSTSCVSVCSQQPPTATGHCQRGEGPSGNERLGPLAALRESVLRQQRKLHQDRCGPRPGGGPECVQRSPAGHWYVLFAA